MALRLEAGMPPASDDVESLPFVPISDKAAAADWMSAAVISSPPE
jgi:hypothetical protein